MLQQRKTAPNGALPPVPMSNMDKSLSFQGARRRHHRSLIPASITEQSDTVYSHPYKRHHQNQSSSVAHRHHHRRKHITVDSNVAQQSYRRYDGNQLNVPEPDYSQTESESANDSVRLRNPSYWANSSDYYHRATTDEHDRRDRADHPHGIIDHNAPSTTQRKRLSLSNHPWPTSAESITAAPNRHGEYPNQKQHTLPTRKSRAITTDLPHVTTITLTDGVGSLGRANGNAFGSSHRPDKLALDNTRRPNYRSDGEQSNQGIRTAPSPRVETVLPSSFSNVNLLKRVNDRYKLTERLLIQLKIIAVLHAFFGFAMFSLDSSHAVVLWPYVEDSSERLYLCLRTFYSVGVVLIGCLSIAISCGKRSVLLDIVKVFCVVLLTTLLVAPSQTTLFRSISDSLQYNDALHRYHAIPVAISEIPQRRRSADSQESAVSVPKFPSSPISSSPRPKWKQRKATSSQRSSTISISSNLDAYDIEADDGHQPHESAKSVDQDPDVRRSGMEIIIAQKGDPRRPRALRIAQHLRIAYSIFACCHFLLTFGTLAVVLRLERLS